MHAFILNLFVARCGNCHPACVLFLAVLLNCACVTGAFKLRSFNLGSSSVAPFRDILKELNRLSVVYALPLKETWVSVVSCGY